MKVVVVGANGFLGSSLVNRLTIGGDEVLAIDASFDSPKIKTNKLVTILQSSLDDITKVKEELKNKKYDLLYNFAWRGVNGPEKSDYEIQKENISLSLKCAYLAESLGCKKYLCAGTIAERAIESIDIIDEVSPSMVYAVSKMYSRIVLNPLCKSLGVEFIWMQFSNVYGPTNKTGNLVSYTINQLTNNEPALFGPANQPYDFIFVDDLIEAVDRLGHTKTSKKSYFIGSGKPMILFKYLEKIGNILGKKDLIRIGARPDDKIKYNFSMFNAEQTMEEIGDYTSGSFDKLIKYTIDNYS